MGEGEGSEENGLGTSELHCGLTGVGGISIYDGHFLRLKSELLAMTGVRMPLGNHERFLSYSLERSICGVPQKPRLHQDGRWD